jgi:flagella basal body P-ring formation protein FlgA
MRCAGKGLVMRGLGLILLLCTAPALALTITLPAAATVRGTEMRLADIAELAGGDAELTAARAVSLGTAPLPGQCCTLRPGTVRMRLRQYHLDPDAVTLTCPEQVIITREAWVIPGDEIVETARQWLLPRLSTPGAEARLAPVRVPEALQLAPGDGARAWSYTEVGSGAGSLRSVALTLTCGTTVAWRGVVTFTLQRWGTVLVTKTALARNQVITAADVALESRTLTASDRPLTVPEMAVGQRTITALPAGAVLTAAALETAPVVSRNALVRVTAACGALLVTVQAVACEDGALNAVIRVRNLDSKAEFYARVVGPGRLVAVLDPAERSAP